MLAVLALEDDGAVLMDLHTRAVAELFRAHDARVMVEEASRSPVMWLLTPKSRYHNFFILPPLPSSSFSR
jgi:hypothetical protein